MPALLTAGPHRLLVLWERPSFVAVPDELVPRPWWWAGRVVVCLVCAPVSLLSVISLYSVYRRATSLESTEQ